MRSVTEIAALGVINRQFAPKARSLFTRALKKGTLTRGLCEVTGKEPAEGHHPDYARPLADGKRSIASYVRKLLELGAPKKTETT